MLATDARYAEAAALECPDLEVLVERDTGPALAAAAAAARGRSVGLREPPGDRRRVPPPDSTPRGRRGPLARADRPVERPARSSRTTPRWLAAEGCLRRGRRRVRRGAGGDPARGDRAHPRVRPRVAHAPPRVRGAELRHDRRRRRATPPYPITGPTDRPFAPGDLVKLDFGAVIAGYHSDMTRTVVLGEPAELAARGLRPGRRRPAGGGRRGPRRGGHGGRRPGCRGAWSRPRGMGERFLHGLGHGVGLEIHELSGDRYASSAGVPSVPGMVVTVEPGVYLAGRGVASASRTRWSYGPPGAAGGTAHAHHARAAGPVAGSCRRPPVR